MCRIAVALMALWPFMGRATVILDSESIYGVAGWSNSRGNFVFDRNQDIGWLLAGAANGGIASYSTASSLFSFTAPSIGYNSSSGGKLLGAADVRINAVVKSDGTDSGDLLAGIVTIFAGVDGFPSAGIAAGEVLMVGTAIDAAARDNVHSVAMLFELTFQHSALSDLGKFVTFFGPFSGVWQEHPGASFPFRPWDLSWGPESGFMSYDFVRTVSVEEPATLALLASCLFGLIWIERRRAHVRKKNHRTCEAAG